MMPTGVGVLCNWGGGDTDHRLNSDPLQPLRTAFGQERLRDRTRRRTDSRQCNTLPWWEAEVWGPTGVGKLLPESGTSWIHIGYTQCNWQFSETDEANTETCGDRSLAKI